MALSSRDVSFPYIRLRLRVSFVCGSFLVSRKFLGLLSGEDLLCRTFRHSGGLLFFPIHFLWDAWRKRHFRFFSDFFFFSPFPFFFFPCCASPFLCRKDRLVAPPPVRSRPPWRALTILTALTISVSSQNQDLSSVSSDDLHFSYQPFFF